MNNGKIVIEVNYENKKIKRKLIVMALLVVILASCSQPQLKS